MRRSFELARETAVQQAVMRLYRAFGCTVIRFAEGRRSRITPGWPDLAVFCPAKHCHWVHEVKAASGVQSPDQRLVQDLAELSDLTYLLGGVEAAEAYLAKLGLVREVA